MKGVLFTEFLEMVEGRFGIATSDQIITGARLANDGAYTSVGTYDHHDLVALVGELSRVVDIEPARLVKAFGGHLFQRLGELFPQFFAGVRTTFEFLPRVEQLIHVEVRKLYADAELPSFEFEPAPPGQMSLVYRSTRPFAPLAEGLIAACVAHCGESLVLEREDLPPGDGTMARFVLSSGDPASPRVGPPS